MERIALGTRSHGKLKELQPLFRAAGYAISTLDELGVAPAPDEDQLEAFLTFEENALAKARYFSRRAGMAVVADDSGLEVLALSGAPGVRSKRWSGRVDLHGEALDDANNAVLLERLRGARERRARYVCVAAFADETGELVARGETEGRILDLPRGSEGFGYDPFFLSDELRATFGEADRSAKELVSHRGRAFRALIVQLRARR